MSDDDEARAISALDQAWAGLRDSARQLHRVGDVLGDDVTSQHPQRPVLSDGVELVRLLLSMIDDAPPEVRLTCELWVDEAQQTLRAFERVEASMRRLLAGDTLDDEREASDE